MKKLKKTTRPFFLDTKLMTMVCVFTQAAHWEQKSWHPSSPHLSYTPVHLHGPRTCINEGRQAKDHSPGAVAMILDLGTTLPSVECPRQPRSRH